jgi:hypothetical protein
MTIQELRVFLSEWFCGCDSPKAACRALRDLLSLHPLYEHRDEFEQFVPDVGLQALLLYTLDHFDLTEHGGTVGGGWLTDKGKALLAALNEHAADEWAKVCASSCCHGYAIDTDEILDCPECGPLNKR